MTIEVEVQDSEQLVVNYLRPLLADDDFTCGRRVPDGWTKTSPGHVQVLADGDSEHTWPVLVHTKIMLIGRGATTEAATALCGHALSLLMAHPQDNRGISGCRLVQGVVPDREESTKDEIASAIVRVTVRNIQV